jgi:hypothetical protein
MITLGLSGRLKPTKYIIVSFYDERKPAMEEENGRLFPDDFMYAAESAKSDRPYDDAEAIWIVQETFGRPISELLTYGVDLGELIDYVVTDKTACEFSYELQCCVFDTFPRWYIAQTPFRNEIYPDAAVLDWSIWMNHWEQLDKFF